MAELPEDARLRSGFLPDRIVHLHPTRRCNLACLHCYSESTPRERGALDLRRIEGALPVLKAEGYESISLSGGDPLMYPHLLALVDSAHAHGFKVSLITNGLFSKERLAAAAAAVDGIAVSFDGTAGIHNWLRGRPDAFEKASDSVAWLAGRGHSVAAALSLTRAAIPELPDLIDFLMDCGVRRFQIRPTAVAGRAKQLGDASEYSATDRARLYLVVLALQQELGGDARIHCDLAPAKGLWEQRGAYAGLLVRCELRGSERRKDAPLADLVNPLVITDTGILKPIAFDFNPRFDIATFQTLSDINAVSSYKRNGIGELQRLIGAALDRLRGSGEIVDWFDHCTRLAESSSTAS
jgi:pyruvate-formate lyase-activating enzyme